MDDSDKRKAIHEALSSAISEADNAMVSGWVLVVEKVTGDQRELELISSAATPENALPEWTGRGWLDHAQSWLEWDDEDVPDEDEDVN